MPVITLPDGSQRHFDHAVSPMDVALDIGPGLAKATIAGRVNGELVDACDVHRADGVIKMALAAIRKRNYRHFMSLFAVVPHTKEHIQNNIIIIITRLRRSSRFTLRKEEHDRSDRSRLLPPADNTGE